MSSHLYVSYKAVGYVCNGLPFAVSRLGDETFILTSIGKYFQVYRIDRLTLCLVSRQCFDNISAIEVFGHDTFAACGNKVLVFDRSKIVRVYEPDSYSISGMLAIGSILLVYDVNNTLTVLDTKQRKILWSMRLLGSNDITSIVHPATYLNKVVLGFLNGQLELWNFKKKKLIHTFVSHLPWINKKVAVPATGGNNAITCMEQSPACDVIAVGLSSGCILLINLKLDKVLFVFQQEVGSGGGVTSLSFRTDAASDKFPFLASSDQLGRIYVWNLGVRSAAADGAAAAACLSGLVEVDVQLERKLEFVLDDAHMGPVSRVHFLHGEPILVTASADNSLKVWIFDSPDGSCRLLRSREGHAGFPTRIRYYGGVTNASLSENADAFSCEILSCGSDATFRLFNTALESQNRELSQKPILKKFGLQRRNERLPLIHDFDFSETREKDWANVVTVHKNHANAYLWRFRHRVVTDVVLKQPAWREYGGGSLHQSVEDRNYHSTAVAMSPCGNFCVVGSRGGPIYMYNVQSGQPRGAFPVSAGSSSLRAEKRKAGEGTPGNVMHMRKVIAKEARGGRTASLKLSDVDGHDEDAAISGDNVAEAHCEGHSHEVTGLHVDMAAFLLVSCGLDGRVIFWDFQNHALLSAVNLSTPLLRLQGFRDGGFVAVAGQDRNIRVFDAEARKVVRRFSSGHSREVTDMAFTPDGRRLLSASLDSTVRVWDLPTGRCLSWLNFDSPVLSMAVSHSGEYLCVAQVDKEGIFMYLDRSLYETVHFYREPTAPSPVADSITLVDSRSSSVDTQGEALDVDDDEVYSDMVSGEEEDQSQGFDVTPAQAQVRVADGRFGGGSRIAESTEQRMPGALTLSGVPRAYWTTLFNLEIIKERNKPIAPPAPLEKAPFFLPTVVRGGATPSFPTPEEFKNIVVAKQMPQISDGEAEGNPEEPTKKIGRALKKTQEATTVEDDDQRIMKELATLGSAWSDGPDDFVDGAEEDEVRDETATWEIDRSELEDGNRDDIDVARDTGANAAVVAVYGRKKTSRLLGKNQFMPRCKLVAFISHLYPEVSLPADEESDHQDLSRYLQLALVGPASAAVDPLLAYLQTLAPPGVDLELRALCRNAEDWQGLRYLHCLLLWLAALVRGGSAFELTQTYLHRTLLVYSETLLARPDLFAQTIGAIMDATAKCGGKLRRLIQSNMCLLKVLSGLPPA